MAWDPDELRLLSGEDIDFDRPLTSGHLAAVAEADPSLMKIVGPYLLMEALPATLTEIEPRAREIYATGWRPPLSNGPSRDDLVALIAPLTAAMH
jgi:hypothetical protein